MKKIHFDEKGYNAELAVWKTLVDTVNAFSAELQLHSLELTSEILKEFMSGPVVDPITGTKKGWPFQGRLLQATLDRFPGATPILYDSLSGQAESIAASFRGHRTNIKGAASKLGIDPATIPIEKGKAVITSAMKSEIRERHTAYLADRDAEAYERMQKFAMSLNELREFLDKEMPPLTLVDPLGGEQVVKVPNILEVLGEISGVETFENTKLPFLNRSGQVVVNPRYFGYRTKKMSNDKTNES